MIKDQVIDWTSGGTVDIPDQFRDSYRMVVSYLLAHNYRVPLEMMELAQKESHGN